MKPIISTTTRKARENEDSNTYNFVDNMTFNLMDAKDEFLEKTSYIIPSEGLVKYGTNKLIVPYTNIYSEHLARLLFVCYK